MNVLCIHDTNNGVTSSDRRIKEINDIRFFVTSLMSEQSFIIQFMSIFNDNLIEQCEVYQLHTSLLLQLTWNLTQEQLFDFDECLL